MPVKTTYPGVYIEELPSGVRTITGVSTSVTAFVGYAPRGPIDAAVRVFNYGEFERTFGALTSDSDLGFAAQQYFLNGGTEAWIVRVAEGSQTASVVLSQSGGNPALRISAASAGEWGNLLRVDVVYATTVPDSFFNLTITELLAQPGGTLVAGRNEVFRNLSMDSRSAQYVVSVVGAGSDLVVVERDVPAADLAKPAGWSRSAALANDIALTADQRKLAIMIDGKPPVEIELFADGATPLSEVANIKDAIVAKVKAAKPGDTSFADFKGAVSNAPDGKKLIELTSGQAGEHSSVRILPASSSDASLALRLGRVGGGREREAAADLRPVQTGTVSGELSEIKLTGVGNDPKLSVKVTDAAGARTVVTGVTVPADPVSLTDAARLVQAAIRDAADGDPALADAEVTGVGDRLRVLPGGDDPTTTLDISDSSGTLATALKLKKGANTATVNVARYALGAVVQGSAAATPIPGVDGSAPTTAAPIVGKQADKTGLYALERVDLFNLLSIPLTATLPEAQGGPVLSQALGYCSDRRAFMIVDPPLTRDTVDKVQEWLSGLAASEKLRRNGAVYFPALKVPDPTQDYRQGVFPASPTLAGLYARTDAARGVWKAPAGTEASLTNAPALTTLLTDMESGVLNPLGCNILRAFPVYGRVSWGARTLVGSDQEASDWKYVPVRRLALYLEESLFRGTQWVVFEPNDEPLWAQIRLSMGSFLHGLFRNGAFQGTTPREAYFVKCDHETTNQDDVNRGVVNILVGFAPLKPAEFVVIQIQQIAGQIET